MRPSLMAAVLLVAGCDGAAEPVSPFEGSPRAGERPSPPGPTASAPSDADGGASGGGARPEARPVTALLAVHEASAARLASVTANAGYATAYELDVAVTRGDVLRVRAQVEVTSEHDDPVRGMVRIVADGAPAGSVAGQNVLREQSHHMPLWADASLVAPESGSVRLAAQVAALREDASPSLRVEDGYGHLVVEQYRAFASVAAAEAAGAKLLQSTRLATAREADSFSAAPNARTTVYSVDEPVLAGDIVRLHGQATSVYTTALEMQGQRLWADGRGASPWSTSNHSREMPTLPLWTDAIDRPTVARTSRYEVTVHGVLGAGASLDAGYLGLLRFSGAAAASGGQGLASTHVDALPPDAPGVLANGPARRVLERPIALGAGDRVRVTGAIELLQPASYSLGVSCTVVVQLVDARDAGPLVGAAKYVTARLERLSLRGETLATAQSAGEHRARLSVSCSREGSSPRVPIADAWLLTERFAAP